MKSPSSNLYKSISIVVSLAIVIATICLFTMTMPPLTSESYLFAVRCFGMALAGLGIVVFGLPPLWRVFLGCVRGFSRAVRDKEP